MKLAHAMMTIAATLFVVPTHAAQLDPEIIIYRFAGVLDNGGGDTAGVATSFHCSNFSGVIENVRVVVRTSDGTLKGNFANPVAHLGTLTVSTHTTVLYSEFSLAAGVINQGTAAIAATSVNVVCTAVTRCVIGRADGFRVARRPVQSDSRHAGVASRRVARPTTAGSGVVRWVTIARPTMVRRG